MSHKIHSDAELEVNLELIGRMYHAIAELHRRVTPQNFTNYLVMAEGPIEQIRRLKAEIDEYLGVKEAVAMADEDAVDLATFKERAQEPSRPFSGDLAEPFQPRSGDSSTAPGISRG
jgi:hypothetical protein